MKKDNDFIYWSEAKNELLAIIDAAAMQSLASPIFGAKKADGTDMSMAEVSNRNSLIAMHNEGVLELARALREKLTEEEDDD